MTAAEIFGMNSPNCSSAEKGSNLFGHKAKGTATTVGATSWVKVGAGLVALCCRYEDGKAYVAQDDIFGVEIVAGTPAIVSYWPIVKWARPLTPAYIRQCVCTGQIERRTTMTYDDWYVHLLSNHGYQTMIPDPEILFDQYGCGWDEKYRKPIIIIQEKQI